MKNIIVISLLFGIIYSSLEPGHFDFKSMLDPFYFSFTTMSTVGYGDYTPKTNLAKVLVMCQQSLLFNEFIQVAKLIKY
jgi:voltage-gated potassium channel